MGEIDPAFVQSTDHPVAGEIPVIDLSVGKKELVSEVRRARETWGFFQVINHGVAIEYQKREVENI